MRIVRDLSPSLQTPEEFYHVYQTSPTAIKNFLYEFYLHNYIVPDDVDWNPLLYIGDIYLRPLMSWVQNEIARGEQFQIHRKEELDLSLPLRAESREPRDFTLTGRILYISQISGKTF